MYSGRHITVVIPALNEERSIAKVLDGLRALRVCENCLKCVARADFSKTSGVACTCPSVEYQVPLVDQIVVGDNGSTDATAQQAKAHGALVVLESERGYGAACLAALAAPVDKDIIVFVDGDHSVVASELPGLLEPMINGADLVIGSRTLGNTERGALSVPQQFGNMLASFLIRRLWSADTTDLGPFRAISQSTLSDLNMQDRQFGWTVEMQVRALQEGKTVVEVPVSTLRRIGVSKISGTVRGVVGAAQGILGTIAKLYWAELMHKAPQHMPIDRKGDVGNP